MFSQTMDPGDSQYVYFGALDVGRNVWGLEANKKEHYIVGILICFKYEGETLVRNLPIPPIIQELT